MTIYLSLLVCLIGLALYLFARGPKLLEIGRIAFAAGLLAFLLGSSQLAVLLKGPQ